MQEEVMVLGINSCVRSYVVRGTANVYFANLTVRVYFFLCEVKQLHQPNLRTYIA